MNFAKAAFARSILRALAGEQSRSLTCPPLSHCTDPPPVILKKEAGVLGVMGSAARGVGRGVNWAWQKSMKHNGPVLGTLGLGLGAAGMYALGKSAINKTRAAYQGFSPEVQAYTRQSPY